MLKGVKLVSKGAKPQHMDRDLYEYSSDIHVYNLYDQEWVDLVGEGLSYLFKDDDAEFEQKMLERGQLEEQSEAMDEETKQTTDKVNELIT